MSRSLQLNLVTTLIGICRDSLSNGSTSARRIQTIDITTFAVILKDIYGNFESLKLTFIGGYKCFEWHLMHIYEISEYDFPFINIRKVLWGDENRGWGLVD